MSSDLQTPRLPSRWALACGWLALGALVFTLLVLAYTGPAYRAEWIGVRTAIFTLLRWAFWGGVACIALGVIAVIWNLRSGSRRMAGLGLVVLVVGAALTVNFIHWRTTAQSVPPIHDITTDTQDPPPFVDVLALRAGAPNPPEYPGEEIATRQREAYPDLEPIRVAAPPAAAFEAALAVVQRMRWALVAEAPAEGRIEATDTTRYFGFKDDVVIRVRADGEGSIVDIRSKSRVGMSDVGTNARRIRDFRDALLARVPAQED
ncbi:MAG: DUF1499 domain-containing protein [Gammaproteobacteria bacterium]|nr:MAG: DUF1499 domain-containing protein [Gammaproteobacteria bacterium]